MHGVLTKENGNFYLISSETLTHFDDALDAMLNPRRYLLLLDRLA